MAPHPLALAGDPLGDPADDPVVDLAGDPAGERIRELRERIRGMQTTTLGEQTLPAAPALATLLPGGGLRRGAIYSVPRGMALLMALLAPVTAEGSWCAVVGMPGFGAEAAAGFGIELTRLALVPEPGEHWLTVASALADVMDLVVLRPSQRTGGSALSRLTARLRKRGATLIVLGDWPQSEATLSLGEERWTGIGDGHGRIIARNVLVTVTARTAPNPRRARLWLPDAEGRITLDPAGLAAHPVLSPSPPASARPAPAQSELPPVRLLPVRSGAAG